MRHIEDAKKKINSLKEDYNKRISQESNHKSRPGNNENLWKNIAKKK